MYKSLLNTVRVPIYKKPGSRGPFFFFRSIPLSPSNTRAGTRRRPPRQHKLRTWPLSPRDWSSRSDPLCRPAPHEDASRTPGPRRRSENGLSTPESPCATPNGQRTRGAPGSISDRALRGEKRKKMIRYLEK